MRGMVLGAAFVILVCGGAWLAYRQKEPKTSIGGSEPPELRGHEPSPNWGELRKITSSALATGHYDDVRSIEQSVLAAIPSRPDQSFAGLALDCAIARRLGGYGDPQELLLLSEQALPESGEDKENENLRLALAKELIEINLYRRSLEVLKKVSPGSMSSEAQQLADLLQERLDAVRPNLVGLKTETPNRKSRRSIQDRLLDLLALLPRTDASDIPHDDTYFFENAREFFKSAEPFRGPPLLIQFFKKNYAEQGEIESSEDEESDVSEFVLSDLMLELLAGVQARTPAGGPLEDQDLLDRLAESLGSREVSSSFLYPDGILIQIKDNSEQDDESDFRFREVDSELAFLPFSGEWGWKLALSSYSGFILRDVNGDGIAELIVKTRQGSGGFLDIQIYEIDSGEMLFSVSGLNHGEFRLIDIDRDSDLEIVTLGGTGDQVDGCTQCPQRFMMEIYDLDRRTQRFEGQAFGTTVSQWSMGTGVGPWGFTAEMWMAVDSEDQPLPALESLAFRPTEEWKEGEVVNVVEVVNTRYELLKEAGFFSSAAELMGRAAVVFNRRNLPPAWADLRLRAHLARTHALYMGGDLELALKVLKEPWVLEKVRTRKGELEEQYLNLLMVLNLSLGRLDDGYEILRRGLGAGTESNEAIEGNLSGYFLMIGDQRSALFWGRKALDTAVRNKNSAGSAVDMMHLASAAANLGRPEEALDWVNRSLRSNKLGGGGSSSGLFEVAASVALDHGYPQIALGLLDEAFAMIDPVDWRTQGGSLLFLYGRALSLLGERSVAKEVLEASGKLSRQLRSSVLVSAYYELSKIYYEEKDAAAALRYAQEAFSGIAAGRILVREEEHKFLYLVQKEEVAAWFFRLLLENPVPSELLDALEAWKMQTFLDVYGAPVKIPSQELPRTNVAEGLKKVLGPRDLLIDFFVSGQTSFVISVTSVGTPRFARLPCSQSDIRRLVETIRAELDLRRSESLVSIRSDKPGADFEMANQKLSQCLLEPVEIPAVTNRLLIASDKDLLGIPWASLVIQGRPLIDRMEVVQVPSALVALRQRRLMGEAPQGKDGRRPVLVVGALGSVSAEELKKVIYPQSLGQVTSLQELGNGWGESLAVSKALAPREIMLHLDRKTREEHGVTEAHLATPEAFLAEIGKAEFVHVVAHGIFNKKAPMQSVIFLDYGRKGRTVRALDIAGLDLRGVKLVSLAACQTGMSGAQPGAEPIGFVRAVLGAGAESVILADWEVDDRTTANLFSKFYSILRDQPSKSRALREAQLAVRAKFRHPYFWAGISLHGLP